MNQENKWIEFRNKFIMTLTSVVLILVACGVVYVGKTTDSIAEQVIRFHVVANSDTTADQMLKQKVRDEIIRYIEPLTKNCNNIDETRQILREKLPVIKKIAETTIHNNGQEYEVNVALDTASFPTKKYGDIIFPAGKYEACRVVIGEGKGENWWCVMYPPLCYLDVSSGVVPAEGKEQLEERLTTEQYKLVQLQKSTDYQVRFKLIDGINSLIHKSDYKKIK